MAVFCGKWRFSPILRHLKAKSVRTIAAFVRTNGAFVRTAAAFVRTAVAFVRTAAASVRTAVAFVRTAVAFVRTAVAFVRTAAAFVRTAAAFVRTVAAPGGSAGTSMEMAWSRSFAAFPRLVTVLVAQHSATASVGVLGVGPLIGADESVMAVFPSRRNMEAGRGKGYRQCPDLNFRMSPCRPRMPHADQPLNLQFMDLSLARLRRCTVFILRLPLSNIVDERRRRERNEDDRDYRSSTASRLCVLCITRRAPLRIGKISVLASFAADQSHKIHILWALVKPSITYE